MALSQREQVIDYMLRIRGDVSDAVNALLVLDGLVKAETYTFQDLGMAVSGVARSFAGFGNIIAQLQMPMIWMQWREEQLMVTTRRLRELTLGYREAVKEEGAQSERARKALAMYNEEKQLAAVYTARMERAQLMMNIQYVTTIANIFPALVKFYENINRLSEVATGLSLVESVAKWKLAAANLAVLASTGVGLPFVGMAIAGIAAATAFTLMQQNRSSTNVTVNVNGAASPQATGVAVVNSIDEQIRRKQQATGAIWR